MDLGALGEDPGAQRRSLGVVGLGALEVNLRRRVSLPRKSFPRKGELISAVIF